MQTLRTNWPGSILRPLPSHGSPLPPPPFPGFIPRVAPLPLKIEGQDTTNMAMALAGMHLKVWVLHPICSSFRYSLAFWATSFLAQMSAMLLMTARHKCGAFVVKYKPFSQLAGCMRSNTAQTPFLVCVDQL